MDHRKNTSTSDFYFTVQFFREVFNLKNEADFFEAVNSSSDV